MSQWEWTKSLFFTKSEIEKNKLTFEDLDKALIDIPVELIKKLEQQAKKKWLSYQAFVKSILYNAVNN
jgi:predicted DNA binding CopG/RHH family protein